MSNSFRIFLSATKRIPKFQSVLSNFQQSHVIVAFARKVQKKKSKEMNRKKKKKKNTKKKLKRIETEIINHVSRISGLDSKETFGAVSVWSGNEGFSLINRVDKVILSALFMSSVLW